MHSRLRHHRYPLDREATLRMRRIRHVPDRIAFRAWPLLMLGVALGIAGHNVVTLYPTPDVVTGTVTETRVGSGRLGREVIRIEISSEAGTFYTSGRPHTFSGGLQSSLRSGRRMPVTVQYSERTGGLVAIPELGADRAATGKVLWPVVGGVAAVLGLSLAWFDFRRYLDAFVLVNVLALFVLGPIAGVILVDPLDDLVNVLYAKP